uniref:Kelch domain containing 7A n=1 Tax=Pelodiscus sinensis TaxID=13735 RepID=K7FHP6_PELSI
DWQTDMQLAGKLALSAVALLLLTAAYRFYKARPSSSLEGFRHRQVNSCGARPGSGQVNRRAHLGGTAVLGTKGPQSSPPQGDERLPNGAEKEKGKEAYLLGSQSQPHKKPPVSDGKGQSPGVIPSAGLVAAAYGTDQETPEAGTGAGGKQDLAGLASKADGSSGASQDVASQQPGVCLSPRHNPCGARLGNAAELTAAGRSTPNPEEEEAGAMSERLAWKQTAWPGQERIQTLQAKSDMGLAINQSNNGSEASYTFSSFAKIQVEENYIQERRPRLRGKVYDYYIQSTSQSVSKERPRSYSGSLPYPEHPPESGELADGGAASEPGSSFSQAAEPDRRFGRKGSFHQIADHPEFQVQMEGFGTPPASPFCLGAIVPGVESFPSLQPDANNQPRLELVAGANFFKVPVSLQSAMDVHLDLGNCYDVLCLAKKQRLDSLQEAAYKVMSDNYLQVLKTQSIYGRLNARERELILQRRMQGRKYVTVADVSTQECNLHTSRLCYYDDEGDVWHHLSHMPMETVSRGCAVCSMFNYLFVVAGCEGLGRHQKSSNRVFCYNPLTNIWQEICPLNQARPHCKLVALDGYLYAIGGECLYTVERYDPRHDRWTFIAPLPNDTFAVAHTATVCDGEIYVTGGTLRYMLLRYVSRSDSWKVSLTSGSKDRTTDMVTAGGFIYRFDLNRSMGISVHRCSPKAKLWYECATRRMPYPACFQCAVVENLVYCISRQFHLRFLADYVSPRFGIKELQLFPSARGTLFPVVLVLPDRDTVQTRV